MSQSTDTAKRAGRLLLKSAEIGRDEGIEPPSDVVVDAVKDPLRQETLLYVFDANTDVSRNALADHLADWDLEADDGSVSDEDRERMRVLLHHKHLPQLVGADLVEYDQEDGTIELTEYGRKLASTC
ncbi:DUF7344 domain-containing protein [Halalkalicoccus tibetensis]|uniref:DUF7344 domain-containing protein n=1 Tax=Halalkalicoccus tibetensis TaxID=175632 RepID=A0ABD5V9N2_9EURY